MAHHQQIHHDRILQAQGLSPSIELPNCGDSLTTGEEEPASDVDEPPELPIKFLKLSAPISPSSPSDLGYIMSQRLRKESLLTQALLTSPELAPTSDTEAPTLTSDGGLTSPPRTITPSPPLPAIRVAGPAIFEAKEIFNTNQGHLPDAARTSQAKGLDGLQEIKVEEGLGRRRCISFACGRQTPPRTKTDKPVQSQVAANETVSSTTTQSKRPCMLRFACPMKPASTEPQEARRVDKHLESLKDNAVLEEAFATISVPESNTREHRDSNATVKDSSQESTATNKMPCQSRKAKEFNRVDFQQSEATRFHEFAGPFNQPDEWTNEQTAYRQKMTISDTLRKENAIRKLGEEAEEEALEEDAEADEENDELNNEDNDDDVEALNQVSDGGNETDDEEGFADSDDESDNDSAYQFWTPGQTTAATSTDHIEHIHSAAHRTVSGSSIESVIDTHRNKQPQSNCRSRSRRRSCIRKSPRMRPSTPELPDSSDFVVGTIDEDRPLEAAYMSCLEQRRRSKHKLIPQDIDPSFPTSDPEADDDDDAEESSLHPRNEPDWIMGRPDSSDEEIDLERKLSFAKISKSPVSSPKRLHSPPPKRNAIYGSLPPRRLFGHGIHRLRSPPPMLRKLTSPPSSRRPSLNGSPNNRPRGVAMPHLAQRPNLTHTTSLPRTPNPFWRQHRSNRFHGAETPSAGTSPKPTGLVHGEAHSRGPIDIVQGLENKRQRRKEKFWRQHCRNAHAGKEKERRCLPGKGAERMRELGLEMVDRCKGYGQKAQLVLSV